MEIKPETRPAAGPTPRGVREGMLRLVDANLNRATEGLRVADDLARFVLDDAGLSGEFKAIRHGVVEAVRATGVDAATRLLSRDTVGDVGTGLTASGEGRRADVASVGEAACGRAAEAMRAIEEACKLLGAAGSARDVEALRYRLYTAGARLTLKLSSGRSGKQWRLCVLVTEALCTQHSWERVVEEAIAGGADCLQLREKTMEAGEMLVRAKRLVEIARASARADGSRASVVINDRPDVALLAGADGVHVGQHDLPVAAVRKLAGFTLAVGVSTANLEQAKRAKADGADSVGLGPMFVSGTKPKPELAGVGYLRAFLADAEVGSMPHLAISGITPENVGELWASGCRGVAVSSIVCGARDPKTVCEKLLVGAAAERMA